MQPTNDFIQPKIELSRTIFADENILGKIFQHLPTMKVVNQVCRSFYKIACEMRKGKDWMRMRSVVDIEDKKKYQSFLNTSRVFNNFAVGESNSIYSINYIPDDDFLNDPWNSRQLLSLLTIHGINLTSLQLMNVEVPMKFLLEILSLTPNLKLLKLFFINQDCQNFYGSVNHDLLPPVSDIIIYECGASIHWFIEHLPANSIKSLTIKSVGFYNLKLILKNQASIVKMNLMSDSENPLPNDLLDDFKLTNLMLNLQNGKNLSTLLDKQHELTFLDVSRMIINNDALIKISQLQKLEKLSFNVSGCSLNVFMRIHRLKNLKFLSLSGALNEHFVSMLYSNIETFLFPNCREVIEPMLLENIQKKFQRA